MRNQILQYIILLEHIIGKFLNIYFHESYSCNALLLGKLEIRSPKASMAALIIFISKVTRKKKYFC